MIKINPYLNPHRQTPKLKDSKNHFLLSKSCFAMMTLLLSYFHQLNSLWIVNDATEKDPEGPLQLLRGPFGSFQGTSLTVHSVCIGLPGLFFIIYKLLSNNVTIRNKRTGQKKGKTFMLCWSLA